MKPAGKIVLIVCVIALLLLTSLAGAIIYYYTHPRAVKVFVENAVSRSTGTSFTIKSLTYSFDPLRVIAKGIIFQPGRDLNGFYLEIPGFQANLSLEGPFGQRSLIIKSLRVESFSCRISKDLTLPKIEQKAEPASFFGAIIERVIALFLFRDLRFQGAELSGGSISAQLGGQTVHVNGVHARVNADHLIELSCGIKAEWPSKKMHLIIPHLDLQTDRAISLVKPQIGFLLVIKQGLLESPGINIRHMKGRAKIIYSYSRRELIFEYLNLILPEIALQNGSQTKTIPSGLHLETEGVINIRDSRFRAHRIQVRMKDVLQLDGKLDGVFNDKRKMKLRIIDCNIIPQKLLSFIPPRLTKRLGPLKLSGPIKLSGSVDGIEEQQEWNLDCDLQTRLKRNRLSFTTETASFMGNVTGDIRVEGRVPDLKITAMMKADHVLFSGTGVELTPFNVSGSISGKYPIYKLKDVSVRIPSAKRVLGKREFMVDDIQLKIHQGRVNVASQAIFLPEIRFSSSLLKNLLISVKTHNGKTSVDIAGKQTGIIKSSVDLGLLPAGWEFTGLDSIRMGLEAEKGGDTSFTGELVFQDLAFQNQDSSSMGEKVSLRAKIDGKLDSAGLIITADTAINLDQGEVLYDRFYFNLKENPFFCGSKWSCDLRGRHLQLSNLSLGLEDILILQINGSILKRGPDWRFDLFSKIPRIPLNPLFSHFILEPFKTEKPFLGGLNVEGAVAADLKLTGTMTEWAAKGFFKWHKGALSSEEHGMSLRGIDLSLPIWYRNRMGKNPLERLKGVLSIRSMNLSLLPEQGLDLLLNAGPNLLAIPAPTLLKVPGGKIRVGPVAIKGLSGTLPSVNTSLTIDSVRIAPLLAGVWSRPVRGTISGKLDPIGFISGNLKSAGEIKAKVFDGDVIFSDLGASGLFAGTPVFKVNARWKNLSFSELTAGTSFGRIEGVLNGYAKDLEIAHGQPQKFDLLLETVERDGTPQRISVKAVDNIAQIGGGQSPFIGIAGLFSSLFKEFPYKKIGVHATLENDVFRMSGTIKEGGREYFVKRGLFSGVDVVNQNPDNRVSFKDMVKRIKRVTASGSGPVIK